MHCKGIAPTTSHVVTASFGSSWCYALAVHVLLRAKLSTLLHPYMSSCLMALSCPLSLRASLLLTVMLGISAGANQATAQASHSYGGRLRCGRWPHFAHDL